VFLSFFHVFFCSWAAKYFVFVFKFFGANLHSASCHNMLTIVQVEALSRVAKQYLRSQLRAASIAMVSG
jgi:hypothetical protein